jgi:hypothetical protein
LQEKKMRNQDRNQSTAKNKEANSLLASSKGFKKVVVSGGLGACEPCYASLKQVDSELCGYCISEPNNYDLCGCDGSYGVVTDPQEADRSTFCQCCGSIYPTQRPELVQSGSESNCSHQSDKNTCLICDIHDYLTSASYNSLMKQIACN